MVIFHCCVSLLQGIIYKTGSEYEYGDARSGGIPDMVNGEVWGFHKGWYPKWMVYNGTSVKIYETGLPPYQEPHMGFLRSLYIWQWKIQEKKF